MNLYFWDTSALAKRYFKERGSAHVRTLLADTASQHWITRLTLAELSSAIVRRIPGAEARRYVAQFDADVRAFQIGRLDDQLVTMAVDLTRRHHIRGCDALQLAAALRLARAIEQLSLRSQEPDQFHFVCADGELNSAAVAEGLRAVEPR